METILFRRPPLVSGPPEDREIVCAKSRNSTADRFRGALGHLQNDLQALGSDARRRDGGIGADEEAVDKSTPDRRLPPGFALRRAAAT